MDLSALKFTVDTTQLAEAISETQKLQQAIDNLGKKQGQFAQNTEKVNRKVTESAAAEDKATKATERKAKATEDSAAESSKATSILEKQVRTLSIFRGESQRAADGVIKLGDSFTKSQSGMLAMMQLADATSSELQQLAKVFTDYNKITGLNTFDKSAQALSKLKKEIEEMQAVTRMQAQGVALTREEYVGLTRDIERLNQAMKAEGATAAQITVATEQLNKEFVQQSLLRNKLLADTQAQERVAKDTARRMVQEAAMMDQAAIKFREAEQKKQQAIQKTTESIELQIRRVQAAQKYVDAGFTIGQANRGARLETSGVSEDLVGQILRQDQANREAARSARDYANAVQFLSDEERKVDAVLAEVTGQTNRQQIASERTAAKVIAYGHALEKSGISATVASAKMETYRQKLLQVEKIETQRRSDFLSRALAPQISDVVVSLGSGQNPLTVLLQQGLQVRDLIGQSGVAVEDLQRTFRTAAADMVSSLRGTAVAIGSLLVGTVADFGKAIVNVPLAVFKNGVESSRISLGLLRGEMERNSATLDQLALARKSLVAGLTALGTTAAATAVIFATVLAIATYQVLQQETALSKALTLTGASLGMSKDEAIAFSESMNRVGVSTTSAINFITALGKESSNVVGDLERITKAADSLRKVAGVSFEDTAKVIENLGNKPTESLIKFAQESGRVEISVLRQVAALEKVGNATEAARIAQEAWASATLENTAEIYNNLSAVEKVWMDITSQIKGAWEAVKEFSKSETLAKVFTVAWQTVAVIVSEVWYVLKATASEIGGIASQLAAFASLDFAGASNIRTQMISDAQSARKEQDALIARIMATGKANDEFANSSARSSKELQNNSKAAREFAKQLKEPDKKGNTEAKKELDRLRKAEIRDIERINDLIGESTRVVEQQTKAQKLAADITSSPDFLKFDPKVRVMIGEMLTLAHANELVAIATQKRREADRKVYEQYVAMQTKSDNATFDLLESLDEQNRVLLEEAESLDILSGTLGKTSEERQRSIELRKIEIALAKELAEINKKDFVGDDAGRTAAIERAHENAAIAARNVNRKIAIDAAFQMQTNLSDAIETALFEGGRAGSKKLRDIIVAELRKPLRVFIEASVKNIFGDVGGFFGGSSGGGASDSTGPTGLGSISNLLSSGKSAFDFLSGGLNAASSTGQMLATSVAKLVGKVGASTLTNMTTQFASGMMSTGSMQAASEALKAGGSQMAGVIAGSVLNGLSGYGISKMISGGYSAGNGINTIAGIASMIPGIGPIAGVVGGLVNRAFGRKAPVTTGTGIEGTFGTTGANVNAFTETFSKGGWFRSDKRTRTTSAVSTEFDLFLDQSLSSITNTTKAFASILGLVPESIDGVTQSINLSLMGLSAEQQQTRIAEALGGFGDKLAKQLLGSFATTTREGETAGQALARLAGSLSTVNAAFDTLSQTLIQASLIGGDAASKLLDAFQGAENFTKLTTDYYQNFYTEQERVATTTRQLTTIFSNMSLALPKTRDEFRALVESQDLYTDSGRATYAALLNLAPAFATITTAVEQFTSAIIDEVRRLRGEIGTTSGQSGLGYFTSQFTAANTAALTGDADALAQLPELSQAVQEAAKLQATTALEVVRIQAWLAQTLSNTSASLGQAVPTFAMGGLHSGGARIVGENGPELEITGPSRIMNASQTAAMLNGNVAEMIANLNDNISGLRAEVRAGVVYNSKMSKLLDRVSPDGESLVVSILT